MMKKTIVFKKTASLVLALLMIVSTLVFLPFGASAEVTATENWGLDNEGYYSIGSAADMLAFMGKTEAHAADAKVRLTADIDMSQATSWAPIAEFKGTFDGQGHTISNIDVTFDSGNAAAIFIKVSGEVEIKNLILYGCTVENTATTDVGCGILVGKAEAEFALENVHVKESTIDAHGKRVGALIGYAKSTTATASVNNCSVVDTTVQGGRQTGGAVGQGEGNLTIRNFYGNATVEGVTGYNNPGNIGGLIGYLAGAYSYNYENCVFAGTVACPDGQRKAGFGADADSSTSVTMTDCLLLNPDIEKMFVSSANITPTQERCVTVAELDTQKEILLANGWVTTADKVTVGEEQVTVIVPTAVCTYFTCPIPTTDVYYQKRENGNGTVDIRFVAVINDLSYANVGFNVQATRGEGDGAQTSQKITKTTTTVYTSVTALGDNVTAESLGGQYIYVIEIKNVDVATYAHSFNVSAFVTVQDGTNQIVWEAATQTLTVAKAS